MWYEVRILRHRLPQLRESKLIHLKKERSRIIKELLKENETDIIDINRLIHAAVRVT